MFIIGWLHGKHCVPALACFFIGFADMHYNYTSNETLYVLKNNPQLLDTDLQL